MKKITEIKLRRIANLLVYFAKHSTELSIAVEQAEDEISAIHMAIASWYAGGRAMVAASYPGYRN